jgi:hypothetical protein
MFLLKKKIAIIHFQPIELYPPVMNMIRFLEEKKIAISGIYTTTTSRKISKVFSTEAKVFRLGKEQEIGLKRYLQYLKFNVLSIFSLFMSRPSIIIVYEYYSVIPAFVYTTLFRKSVSAIHFHEYLSKEEIKKGSVYLKFVVFIGNLLARSSKWISHTNEDRKRLYYLDNPKLKGEVSILANYPPSCWFEKGQNAEKREIIRFVYVGALSLHTMYTKEFSNWIISGKGKCIWDIYSDNYSDETLTYFQELNTDLITVKEAINYYDLPGILRSYDIGVVLYNGYIPNHIFSVPNKVCEYLACGLNVWCSENLMSTLKFKADNNLENIKLLDFTNLNVNTIFIAAESNTPSKNVAVMNYEYEYQRFMDNLYANSDTFQN